jgi:hypothetical protein
MGRYRFVEPEVTRLYLVDVHRRALEDLIAHGTPGQSPVPATPEDIAIAKARIVQAEDDGEWIEVKRELNAGDSRRVFTDLVKEMHAGEKATLDPEQVGKTKILTYVLGWSLRDRHGKGVPFTESALDNLDTDTYKEISDAVDAHDEAVEKARADRIKKSGGEIASSTI